jgi:FtsZ-interacting cell division protein ZipA
MFSRRLFSRAVPLLIFFVILSEDAFAMANASESKDAPLFSKEINGANTSRKRGGASHCSSAGHQVDDQHNHRNHQQQVDQASCDVEAPSQQPENQQNRENCPKHSCHLGSAKLP